MGVLKRTIRGIRDSLPSGYVVGRLSSQEGPAELIDLATLSHAQVAAVGGGGGGSGGGVADFGVFFSGKPAASQVCFEMVMTKAVQLPKNLSGSQFATNTAPTTGNYVFTLNKNGSSIGTVTFAVTSGTPTVSFTALVPFAIGDKFQIVGQVSPDANMADIAFSFAATFV